MYCQECLFLSGNEEPLGNSYYSYRVSLIPAATVGWNGGATSSQRSAANPAEAVVFMTAPPVCGCRIIQDHKSPIVAMAPHKDLYQAYFDLCNILAVHKA